MVMKALAVIVVLSVASVIVLRTVGGSDKPSAPVSPAKATPAPEFAGISDWLNAKELKIADQKGKVVVVHFWTNGCYNCVNNYPHYRAWQEKYKDTKDYVMVGVHTPEFASEKDLDRLKDRIAKNKLTFAVAVDNDSKTWTAWGNEYWPCVYLVDKVGNIREKWVGELQDAGFKTMTAKIDELLKEKVDK
jgi:peroxiredoxin